MNFKSKVFRFRDRVPVHRLFVKIFSWFWVTALVIIGIIFVGRRVMDLRPIESSSMYASVASMLAAEAARAYESGGPAGFTRFASSLAGDHKSQLFLLDEFNKDVLSRAISRETLRLASEAGKDQLVTKYIRLHEESRKETSAQECRMPFPYAATNWQRWQWTSTRWWNGLKR